MPKPKPRRRSHLQPLGQLVRRVHPQPDQVDDARLFAWWVRALPPRVVERARPVRLRHGTLHVHCASSAWAQELSFMADTLLARVQVFAPDLRIRDLRFRVGPLPAIPRDTRFLPPPPPRRPATELPEDVGRALARIHDDELRQAVARAASYSLGR
ncbi:MAG: DUF721 domain-containing protein [Myxococcota bacterium]